MRDWSDADAPTVVTLSTSHPVARKEHRCLVCPKPIRKGEKYLRWVGLVDGEFVVQRMHLGLEHYGPMVGRVYDYEVFDDPEEDS